jgi:hypothetical protein
VRDGAPGLSWCATASPVSSEGASAVVANVAEPVAEAVGARTSNADYVPSGSHEEYFEGLLDSISLGCAAEFLLNLSSTATNLADDLPSSCAGDAESLSKFPPTATATADGCAGEVPCGLGDVNPLDAVYEAVAALSWHCKAMEAGGWVDVNMVDAAASWAFHCDVAHARPIVAEALCMWDVLDVMEFRQELSLVKFVVCPELSEINSEVANLVVGGHAGGHSCKKCRACQLRCSEKANV